MRKLRFTHCTSAPLASNSNDDNDDNSDGSHGKSTDWLLANCQIILLTAPWVCALGIPFLQTRNQMSQRLSGLLKAAQLGRGRTGIELKCVQFCLVPRPGVLVTCARSHLLGHLFVSGSTR